MRTKELPEVQVRPASADKLVVAKDVVHADPFDTAIPEAG